MNSSYVEVIDKLTSLLERSPLDVALALLLLTFIYIFHRLAKDIKFEHVFQHTLSNKIKRLKNEINDGIHEEKESMHLKKRCMTLLNQQVYGVKKQGYSAGSHWHH